MILILTGCKESVSPEEINSLKAKVLYSQYNAWYLSKKLDIVYEEDIITGKQKSILLDGIVNTVNYSIGKIIPINSKVKILHMVDRGIIIEVNSKKLLIENREKYSGLNDMSLLSRYLKNTKVKYFAENTIHKAIRSGFIIRGMSKEEVILTRGYPPIHKTKSLDLNKWRYWEKRNNSRNYVFKNNVLIDLED